VAVDPLSSQANDGVLDQFTANPKRGRGREGERGEDVRFVGALIERDESVEDVRARLVVVVAARVVLQVTRSRRTRSV
jgi:hypothetical protein